MRRFKIRVLNNISKTYGVSIPKDIALFFKETKFIIERSGTSIILTSGAEPMRITKSDIEKYKYEDCIV